MSWDIERNSLTSSQCMSTSTYAYVLRNVGVIDDVSGLLLLHDMIMGYKLKEPQYQNYFPD